MVEANRELGVSVVFPSVSVVIPALNEARNIPHVFERIPEDVHQVVLVDGADFAKGTRFRPGGGSADITRLRAYGNHALTSFFNVAYHRRYSDLCYGYNVFWRRHLGVLGLDATSLPPADGSHLWGDGFEVETLIHVRVAKAGLSVAEVPSFEFKRIHGVSNLNATRDGLRVVWTIFGERARSRRQQGHGAPLTAAPTAAVTPAAPATDPQADAAAQSVKESIG